MRLLATSGLLLLLGCAPATSPARDDACPRAGHRVVVETRDRVLWLCSGGKALARVPVALGRGGVDKRREGDGRTPLGTYALGEPRPSRFGGFIPIGYPTAAQRAQGFTGSHVGIHGPWRGFAWVGRPSTWLDWTAGCVATGTDEDLALVADFVRERRPDIVLR